MGEGGKGSNAPIFKDKGKMVNGIALLKFMAVSKMERERENFPKNGTMFGIESSRVKEKLRRKIVVDDKFRPYFPKQA